ncbi:hypothetical protein [Bacillus toyonensis]|uniref:hypothetical protein n=1 Tax=Bacillus toyonensis TaxID=155322 RepID=UPI00211D5E44|nr:hypothetical protein [Bacillus toyonensis]
MGVRKAGRRKISNNGDFPPSNGYQTYSYVSPKVTLECEKLTEDELKALSSDVKTYRVEEINKNKEAITVIADDSNGVYSFFVKKYDIKEGDIVKDPLGNEFKVMVKISVLKVLVNKI